MNSSTKYQFRGTAGKWEYAETKTGKHKVINKNGWSIATTPGYNKECKADAILIASSPLLLSALIKAVEAVDQEDEGYNGYFIPNWYSEAKEAIEAALNLKTVQP